MCQNTEEYSPFKYQLSYDGLAESFTTNVIPQFYPRYISKRFTRLHLQSRYLVLCAFCGFNILKLGHCQNDTRPGKPKFSVTMAKHRCCRSCAGISNRLQNLGAYV